MSCFADRNRVFVEENHFAVIWECVEVCLLCDARTAKQSCAVDLGYIQMLR